MTIAKYTSGLELIFNPPDFLAIYLMAKAFNVDVRVMAESLEWMFKSTRQDNKMMDIHICLLYKGGYKFTLTHKSKRKYICVCVCQIILV